MLGSGSRPLWSTRARLPGKPVAPPLPLLVATEGRKQPSGLSLGRQGRVSPRLLACVARDRGRPFSGSGRCPACHAQPPRSTLILPEVDESLVGSPDFKSVREALTLSWVGSIPTHLRHSPEPPPCKSAVPFDRMATSSGGRRPRSLQDLLTFLGEIEALGIGPPLHWQCVDTTTPAGPAMFQMCGVLAEFERSINRERVNAGLARARANGKRMGRPRVGPEVEKTIRLALRHSNKGIRKIARELGCKRGAEGAGRSFHLSQSAKPQFRAPIIAQTGRGRPVGVLGNRIEG